MVAGIVGIFALSQKVMEEKHVSTDHYRIDAELAQEELVRLQQLQTTLSDNKADIDKTAKIVADSQQYQFQDQVVNDVTRYASRYNIDILSFDFGIKPGAISQGAATGGSSQQKTAVSVQLNNNIPYDSLLKFLKSLENNVTKMQLTGLSLQPNVADANQILAPTIELEVFLR